MAEFGDEDTDENRRLKQDLSSVWPTCPRITVHETWTTVRKTRADSKAHHESVVNGDLSKSSVAGNGIWNGEYPGWRALVAIGDHGEQWRQWRDH